MADLDTNVLVRYLEGDDTAQQALAAKLLRSAIRGGETLYVPITVTLELVCVLRSNFGLPKEQVTAYLAALLAAVELSFESEPAIEIALAQYKRNSADFADCMHIALAHVAGQSPLWIFDRAASKVFGAKMLAANQVPGSSDSRRKDGRAESDASSSAQFTPVRMARHGG